MAPGPRGSWSLGRGAGQAGGVVMEGHNCSQNVRLRRKMGRNSRPCSPCPLTSCQCLALAKPSRRRRAKEPGYAVHSTRAGPLGTEGQGIGFEGQTESHCRSGSVPLSIPPLSQSKKLLSRARPWGAVREWSRFSPAPPWASARTPEHESQPQAQVGLRSPCP